MRPTGLIHLREQVLDQRAGRGAAAGADKPTVTGR
jgi:hypothetical protein